MIVAVGCSVQLETNIDLYNKWQWLSPKTVPMPHSSCSQWFMGGASLENEHFKHVKPCNFCSCCSTRLHLILSMTSYFGSVKSSTLCLPRLIPTLQCELHVHVGLKKIHGIPRKISGAAGNSLNIGHWWSIYTWPQVDHSDPLELHKGTSRTGKNDCSLCLCNTVRKDQ